MSLRIFDLNEDCIREICKYLPISDQTSLVISCRILKKRIVSIWRHTVIDLDLDSLDIMKPGLIFFLNTAKKSVRSLRSSVVRYNEFMNSPLHCHLRHLKRLSLIGSNWNTQICFNKLGTSFPHLQELMLYNVTVDTSSLCDLSKLEKLQLLWCKLTDQHSLHYICSCMSLKYLDMRIHDDYDTSTLNISEGRSKHLEELLTYQNFLQKHLHDVVALKHLKRLYVRCMECNFVDEHLLNAITMEYQERLHYFGMFALRPVHTIKLHILRMTGIRVLEFHNMNIPYLDELAELPHLQELLLIMCRGFSNEALFTFVRYCRSTDLKFIDLNGCQHLCEDIFWAVAEYLQVSGTKICLPLTINLSGTNLCSSIDKNPKTLQYKSVMALTLKKTVRAIDPDTYGGFVLKLT